MNYSCLTGSHTQDSTLPNSKGSIKRRKTHTFENRVILTLTATSRNRLIKTTNNKALLVDMIENRHHNRYLKLLTILRNSGIEYGAKKVIEHKEIDFLYSNLSIAKTGILQSSVGFYRRMIENKV